MFEAMHDALYSQEDSIGLKPWAHFASDAGVSDTAIFSRCLRDESMAQIVIRDTVAAHELGVHGTPTFLVNDLKVLGFASAASLDSVVTSALMAAKRQDGAR